jgi:hypothetical protein
MLRKWLQHHLHPLNLWCRVGGRFTNVCKIYEKHFWQPYLRRLVGGSSSKESDE